MSTRVSRIASAIVASTLVASCGLMPGSHLLGGDGATTTFSKPGEIAAVEMSFDSPTQTRALGTMGVDYWSIDRKNKRFKAALSQDQYDRALKLGMKLIRRNDKLLNSSFDKKYHTYETLLADLKQVAAKYPNLVELGSIGPSWEKTQGKADRDIWAVHFKKGAGKPVVLFAAATHARELVTPEMALNEIHHLTDDYGKDAEVTAAVDNRDIWIVPMVNPDGHIHAEKGESQRKNTNNITGGHSHIGVDLNRNYDASWGTSGDSGNPDSDVFRGTKAFSEPETQAMRDFISRIKPVMFLTFHSFSNSVMWSWDKSEEAPPDKRLEPIGKALGKLSGYDAYQGCQMYLNSGDDVDWSFEHLGTLAYTVEVGSYSDNFDPPFSRVAQFWNENKPMMMYCLKIADNPNAVFGPSLTNAAAPNGNLTAQAETAVTAAEYFVGEPGRPGTGTPMQVGLQRVAARVNGMTEGHEVVWVHARGSNGAWGPWSVTWSN